MMRRLSGSSGIGDPGEGLLLVEWRRWRHAAEAAETVADEFTPGTRRPGMGAGFREHRGTH